MTRNILTIIILVILTNIIRAEINENELVAAVIIAEAGGEGPKGMQAVASVIQNRARRGPSPYDVVVKRKQFSCLNNFRPDSYQKFISHAKRHPNWRQALILAKKVANKTVIDNTNGATHYCANQAYWEKEMCFTIQIKHHKFYRKR